MKRSNLNVLHTRLGRTGLSGLAAAALLLCACPAQCEIRVGRDRALGGTVSVTVETRFGTVRRATGYLFGSTGNVITPYHVVSDARRIQVLQPDLGVFTASRVKRYDPRLDIAVLALDSAQQLPVSSFATLADSGGVKSGDRVYVLHHPAYGDTVEFETSVVRVGYARQMTDCYLTQTIAPDSSLIELSGPFDSGSAGGLVLNEQYDLIGMIVGGQPAGSPRTVYAMQSNAIESLLNSGYIEGLSALATTFTSDAQFHDRYLGAAPQPLDYSSAMPEGFLVWFSPVAPVAYEDAEFTSEINDKIAKNWFYSADLSIDNRPLREWSASRVMVLPASVNPWGLSDAGDRLIHFDADSRFSKIIYKNKITEERIMTRYLLAMPLPPGEHAVVYQNKGANYKMSGIIRRRVTVNPSAPTLLDITGLSLVSMKLLPKTAPGVGEKQSVRYELERKPLGAHELNFMLRKARFPLKP